ncbi:MAG: folylpolyglutamate synthase/dihydrofolate synthase family protein [Nitrospiraceae bacterium]
MAAAASPSIEFLLSLQRHGIKLGLESMRSLLAAMGDPHRSVRSIHIAGTNGKGSTAALTASMLQAAGYRVGLYTSPHLIDFHERIRIDCEPIPDDELARWTTRVRAACPPSLRPTFFEFTTAIAFAHFAAASVDCAVIEVGLGGRFDATNVVTPLATCITTIGMDHEAYLGHNLRSIAYEKAGIVKADVPLVVGRVADEAYEVIAHIATARSAPLVRLGRDFDVAGTSAADCTYRGPSGRRLTLRCPLRGRHQLDNLACAAALIDTVADRGLVCSDEAMQRGAATVDWPGRVDIVATEPLTILDGAHNPAAAAALTDTLRELRGTYPTARVWALVGMMHDKDQRGFFEQLLPLVDELMLTVPNLPRAASLEYLRAALPPTAPTPRLVPSVAHALREIRTLAAPTDLVCVTGSLMLIGEAKAALSGLSVSPLHG